MSRELQKVRDAIVPAEDSSRSNVPVPFSNPDISGLFTFRYSSTEIFSQDGHLHVKMKETRFQDGRLTSEECEGTVDRQAYNQLVNEAQGYFLNQMTSFMKLLYAPFSRR